MFTNTDIANHFERCEVHYRYFWNLAKSRSMHYGYWDENTTNFHEARLNINRIMAQKTGISPTDHVLDAGCGVGGSSIWLAQNLGCRVTGITVSKKQKEQAENYAAALGLSDRSSFFQENYLDTSFPPESFDVVWGIESICYAPEKKIFFQEAYRLLKPGGRLIVADFFKKDGLMGTDKKMIDQMAYGWAITDFATIEDFQKNAAESQFNNIITEDVSRSVEKSAKRLYMASFPGIIGTKLYAFFRKPSEVTKYHARTANIQYRALKKGLWSYQLFQAQKE